MTDPCRTDVETPDFNALYLRDSDPWLVGSSWYERRKLGVLMASLPRERYLRCWEPGCGPGLTTAVLASRTANHLATDVSAVAIVHARERSRELSHVRCVVSELPATPTRHLVDLLVVAEFLYYVENLDVALDTLWSSMAPGGNVAFMHWVHHPEDAYRSGRDMHTTIEHDARSRAASHLVAHLDRDFVLDIYETPS